MAYFFLLLSLLVFSLAADESGQFDLMNFHGEPSAIVGGHVNVMTGDFIDFEQDCVLPGPVPFAFERSYSSSSKYKDTYGLGWHISYDHSARWGLECIKCIKTNILTVLDGMGSHIRYKGFDGSKRCSGGYHVDEKIWDLGMTNFSASGISGKTNVKNDEAWLNSRSGNLRYGNGDVLFFRPISSEENEVTYLPTEKAKLNKSKEVYSFDDANRLSKVELCGHGDTTLGSYQLSYIKTERGKKKVRVETPIGPIKYSYTKYGDKYQLSEVVRPNYPQITYEVGRGNTAIAKKSFPDDRFTQVIYSGKVSKILKPLGETAEGCTQYEFCYNSRPESKHKPEKMNLFNGYTEVYDAEGHKKVYSYEKNRLTSIESFLGKKDESVKGGNLFIKCKEERFYWGVGDTEGYFLGKTIHDNSKSAHMGSHLKYDSFGNITQETLFGNLTGNKQEGPFPEVYFKERAYSHDQKNLLLEEWDYKKKVIYRYLEGTNLISAKFLTDHQKICKREFFEYDENGFKTKEIIDDGCRESIDDLTGVNQRLITEYKPRTSFPFGLAEEVTLKAVDPTSGAEKQLKRLKNHHTIQGWLKQVDVFDAHNKLNFSKKYRYNKLGNVIYEKTMDGTREFAYDANGNKIEEKGPLPGFRKTFSYDYCNRLIKEEEFCDDSHLVKSYRYNLKSELVEETDFSGNTTRYEYDDLGRKTATLLPEIYSEDGICRLKTSTEYNCLDHPTAITDPKGNKTKILSTVRGKPYLTIHPDGTSEKNIYESDGSLKESTDKYDNKTVLTNDYQGRPVCMETFDPSGVLLKRTTSEYSAFHLIRETDALGCTTHYDYDFAGRLISKRRGAFVEEYAYDHLSRLYKTTTWTKEDDAVIVTKRFDHNDRVIEEITTSLSGILQAKVNYSYNALGNRIQEVRQVQDDDETITLFIYNARGDLIETINAMGLSTRVMTDYNFIDERGERGIRTISIDPKGVQTIVNKNPLGFEKRVEKKNSLGETIQLWEILYNNYGEKSKRVEIVYTDGKPLRKVTTAWKWDSLGRLKSITEALATPDEKTTSILYNDLGQQEAIVKPSGLKVQFSYDQLGRVSRWYGSDRSFDYRYHYDANDNPLRVDDAVFCVATTKTYDSEGRLIEEGQSNGLTVRHGYDFAGRATRFTYHDGSSVAYDYEGARVCGITRFTPENLESYRVEGLEHDFRGRLKTAKLPLNAGEIQVSHDAMGRTTGIISEHWKETVDAYDPAGNMLSRTIQDPTGTLNESFQYDELNQLTYENGSQYRFDSTYNRVQEDDTKNTVNDLNQVLERKDRSYRYDVDGNLIELIKPDKTLRFGYDASGRMTSFTDGSVTAHYRYDEMNRRTVKIVNGKETRYIYNGQCELGTKDELRILGGHGLGAEIGDAIAIEKGNSIFVPHHDHNGNLMCLVDAKTGQPTYHARYSAFGNVLHEEGEGVSWGFSSKRKDSESGLIFFGRRYYDPESGRFITKDPLGEREGPNLYAYVLNNPLMFIDLWGLRVDRIDYWHDRAYNRERESNGSESSDSGGWLSTGVEYGIAAIDYGIGLVGKGIEMFSHHFLPPGPLQHCGEGFGRVLQGESFSHKDPFCHPVARGCVGYIECQNAAIAFISGIMNHDETTLATAQEFSDMGNGVKVGYECHRSTGFLNDLINYVHLLCGVDTQASQAIRQSIIKDYRELKARGVENPLIVRNAHSRGGMELYQALKGISPEILSCVLVYTYGSAYMIPPDGLYGATNYVNPNDFVGNWGAFISGKGANIEYTNYASSGAGKYIADHSMEAYRGAMKTAVGDMYEQLRKRG